MCCVRWTRTWHIPHEHEHKCRLQRRLTIEFMAIMCAHCTHTNCVPSHLLWYVCCRLHFMCLSRLCVYVDFICFLRSLLLKDNVLAWKSVANKPRRLTFKTEHKNSHQLIKSERKKKLSLLYFDFCLSKKIAFSEFDFTWIKSKWNWYAICCSLVWLEYAI